MQEKIKTHIKRCNETYMFTFILFSAKTEAECQEKAKERFLGNAGAALVFVPFCEINKILNFKPTQYSSF